MDSLFKELVHWDQFAAFLALEFQMGREYLYLSNNYAKITTLCTEVQADFPLVVVNGIQTVIPGLQGRHHVY